MTITIQGIPILVVADLFICIVNTKQTCNSDIDLTKINIVIFGDNNLGVLIVEHRAVWVAEFVHDGALVDVGTGELLAVGWVGAEVGQGLVNVAVAGGGDVGAVTGLSQQQGAVGAIASVGKVNSPTSVATRYLPPGGGSAIGRQSFKYGQRAVRILVNQAVRRREAAVIAVCAATTRNHSPEHHHCQYDRQQFLHACKFREKLQITQITLRALTFKLRITLIIQIASAFIHKIERGCNQFNPCNPLAVKNGVWMPP